MTTSHIILASKTGFDNFLSNSYPLLDEKIFEYTELVTSRAWTIAVFAFIVITIAKSLKTIYSGELKIMESLELIFVFLLASLWNVWMPFVNETLSVIFSSLKPEDKGLFDLFAEALSEVGERIKEEDTPFWDTAFGLAKGAVMFFLDSGTTIIIQVVIAIIRDFYGFLSSTLLYFLYSFGSLIMVFAFLFKPYRSIFYKYIQSYLSFHMWGVVISFVDMVYFRVYISSDALLGKSGDITSSLSMYDNSTVLLGIAVLYFMVPFLSGIVFGDRLAGAAFSAAGAAATKVVSAAAGGGGKLFEAGKAINKVAAKS